MNFEQGIQFIKGVGPKKAQILKSLGIENIYDLVTYYPKRYSDQSEVTPIAMLNPDETVNIAGRILTIQEKSTHRGMKITTAILVDTTGSIQIVWFNQPFIKKTLKINDEIFVKGKTGYAYGGYGQLAIKQVINYFKSEDSNAQYKFAPLYALPEFIKPKFFRTMMQNIIDSMESIPNALPQNIIDRYNLLDKLTALQQIHFPNNKQDLTAARQTLIFEELFLIQCGLIYMRKLSQQKKAGIHYLSNNKLVGKLLQNLPFALTADQNKAWHEIYSDMEKNIPMQRLLQGDVGSGKTVIAMLALIKAVENGYQGALMAPTEVLAKQHLQSFELLLAPLGIKVGLLTGSLSAKEHRIALENIAAGDWQIVIGTHALIQDKVEFNKLGLVVTDEQHRFGVAQRARLENKATAMPDVLVMTATPIPRTMTLTVYGDLDVSSIYHLPPGRQPIRTFLRTEEARPKIYKFVHDQIDAGRQAYVVCPLIELSDNIKSTSVEEIYDELSNGVFHDIKCALLHGKLSAAEKEDIMQRFSNNEIKLLISTTVIEVGVNVPNASVMVVEGADRFGLAQLHQLRGRIGRGEYKSYCILLSNNKNDNSKQRLELMEKVSDGFKLAEEDLKLRGPGQFFGSMQHGLPDLKIADVFNDAAILLQARTAAEKYCQDKNNLYTINKIIQLQYKNNFLHINDV